MPDGIREPFPRSAIPLTADTLLRRTQTAAALCAAGYPVSDKTLATKATRGGGPPFQLFGRIPLYRWGDVLAWAQARMSAPRCCSAEADGWLDQPANVDRISRGTVKGAV